MCPLWPGECIIQSCRYKEIIFCIVCLHVLLHHLNSIPLLKGLYSRNCWCKSWARLWSFPLCVSVKLARAFLRQKVAPVALNTQYVQMSLLGLGVALSCLNPIFFFFWRLIQQLPKCWLLWINFFFSLRKSQANITQQLMVRRPRFEEMQILKCDSLIDAWGHFDPFQGYHVRWGLSVVRKTSVNRPWWELEENTS